MNSLPILPANLRGSCLARLLAMTLVWAGALGGVHAQADEVAESTSGRTPASLSPTADGSHSTEQARPSTAPATSLILTASGVTVVECSQKIASELEIAVNKRIIAYLARRDLADQLELPATPQDIRLVDLEVLEDKGLPNGGIQRTVKITFGDRFEQQIDRRIREHHVWQRLAWVGAGSGGVFAGLSLLLGALKVTGGRR